MVNSQGSRYSDLASEEVNLKQLKITLHFVNLTVIFLFFYYYHDYLFFFAPPPILSLHDYDKKNTSKTKYTSLICMTKKPQYAKGHKQSRSNRRR